MAFLLNGHLKRQYDSITHGGFIIDLIAEGGLAVEWPFKTLVEDLIAHDGFVVDSIADGALSLNDSLKYEL